MNKHQKIEITRQTIAKLLNTTEGNVRKLEYRNDFDFNNLENLILYLSAQIILSKLKTESKTKNLAPTNQRD